MCTTFLPLFELTPKKFHISAGETVPEQVHCCMRVLQEFQGCSVEVDGVQLLRTKFSWQKISDIETVRWTS